MPDIQDADVEPQTADEEPIFEDENNRLETGMAEAEPVDMEVDEGSHRASTFAGEGSYRVSTFTGELRTPGNPEQEPAGAQGGVLPGVSSEPKQDEFVDCLQESANIDSSCIRDFGAEVLTMIVKQETVLKRLQSELRAFEEGSEAYKARHGLIEVMNQMVEYCRLAMQKAYDYSPPPSYPSGNVP
eukprot:6466213-Amphidinium_carterae.1